MEQLGEAPSGVAAPIPPRTFMDELRDYWPIITAIVAALWVGLTWMADQRKISEDRLAEATKQAEVRLFEARKPFLEKRLAIFIKTAELTGKLQNLVPNSLGWQETKDGFFALRWSEMEMVGDPGIRQAMRRVQYAIVDLEKAVTDDNQHRLRWMVECLADELRLSLEASWGPIALSAKTASGEERSSLPNGCYQGREARPIWPPL